MLWSLAACSGFLQFQSCDGNCSHPYNGLPGSCPETGAATGEVGGPCDGISCNGNARCVNNTCLPCGADGQVCCAPVSEEPSCNPGVTCAGGEAWGDSYGMCTSSCGESLGAPCCGGDGMPCSVGVCSPDTKTCVDPTGTSGMCQGSTQYVAYGLDPAGCVMQTYNFSADGSAAAEQCLTAMAASQGLTPSALNATLYPGVICEMDLQLGFPSGTTYVNVTNQSQLNQCEQYLCSGACSFTQGACPGG